MTPTDALLELAGSTAAAAAAALESVCGRPVEVGRATVVSGAPAALEALPVPGVAAVASYVGGAGGYTLFVGSRTTAHRLAAAIAGADPEPTPAEGDLDEPQLSAVAEAMSAMTAAASAATAEVLGSNVEISPPRALAFDQVDTVLELLDPAPYATAVELTLLGEPCRLIQLVPSAFVAQLTRALGGAESAEPAAAGAIPLDQIRNVTVRLSAEVGRARVALAALVKAPSGTVVCLDREADDPIDLYVNGRPFGVGRLVVDDGGAWAVRVESLLGVGGDDGERR